ncbi:YlbG family protein [Limosilactobacillus caecicola]|uniref:YlbG family protein n=1 Tax=Limosilactobacillus caecicola TaxID=2941332 RepID=UPI00203D6E35|nr:YlbG family protein [Limosilactobacillus caecicola]
MFELTKRQGLIVYINNKHVLRRLGRYGNIMYVSRRMHYVVLYVDQAEVEEVEPAIAKLHNVTSVEISQWPAIDPTVFHPAGTGTYKKNDEDD